MPMRGGAKTRIEDRGWKMATTRLAPYSILHPPSSFSRLFPSSIFHPPSSSFPRRLLLVLLLASLAPSPASAAKPTTPPVVRHEDAPAAPVVSVETDWLRPALVVAAALFAAAVLIGPIYRHSQPEEFLPTHSHDE